MSEHTPAPSHGGPEHPGAAGKLGKLGTKVGGLPVWAWGSAVLGGLVIAWYIRGRSSSAAPTDPTTADVLTAESPGTGGAGYSSGGYSLPTTTPTDTSGGGGSSAGGSTSDPASTDPGTTDPTATDPGYDYTDGYDTADPVTLSDNDWRVAMIRAMVAAGHSPITAEQALSSYLGGKPLTQAQAQVLNQAMTATGPRPDAAPTPSVIPQAKPKPKPPVHTPTHTKAPAPKHKPAHKPAHHTTPAAHHPSHHPLSTRDHGKAPHHPEPHHPAPHHPAPHHKPKKGHK